MSPVSRSITKRLSDNRDVKHECSATAQKISNSIQHIIQSDHLGKITYGILSLINCVDCGGGRKFLGDDRIEET